MTNMKVFIVLMLGFCLVSALDVNSILSLTGIQLFTEPVHIFSTGALSLTLGNSYAFNDLLTIDGGGSLSATALLDILLPFSFSIPSTSSVTNSGSMTISNGNLLGLGGSQSINIIPSSLTNTGTITLDLARTVSDATSLLVIDAGVFVNSGTISYIGGGAGGTDPNLLGNILQIGSVGNTIDNTGTIHLNAAPRYNLLGNIIGDGGVIDIEQGTLVISSQTFTGN